MKMALQAQHNATATVHVQVTKLVEGFSILDFQTLTCNKDQREATEVSGATSMAGRLSSIQQDVTGADQLSEHLKTGFTYAQADATKHALSTLCS